MRRCSVLWVVGLLLMPVAPNAQEPYESNNAYEVRTSTPTKVQLRQMRRHRPRKPPLKQLKDMPRKFQREIKKTSPNPKVRSPAGSPMPAHSPDMPKGPVVPPTLPPTPTERFFAGAAKIMTRSWKGNIFVWLPAISTDPNTGPTYGVLPVVVLSDPTSHHIRHLLAPSYTYNSLFGQTGTLRYYWYPSDSSQYVAIGSMSQRTNREAKMRYENTDLMDGVLYVRGEAFHDIDASRRFFGIGAESREEEESGYTSKNSVAQVNVGINFFNSWRAAVGARFRRMETGSNIIPNTPDIAVAFPATPGLGTNNTTTGEFRLLWDSRDLPITPSRGSSGEIFVEKTSHTMGSDSDYFRYGMEGKRFFLWRNPKYVTVIRGLYEKANGSFIPFYELPSVGGRESLRGYGDGRFVDLGRMAFSLEHRITFSSLEMMGIRTNFEIAPFVDVGSVFSELENIQRKNFRPVGGAAFRAAVKPNVVGDVEVGIGREGPAVFVDINYPY